MLKDTDDRLLCPKCGGELWVGTEELFYGPAYYDAEHNDYLDHAAATKNGATEIVYRGLRCQRCKWMTRQVDEYLEEAQNGSR